MNLEPKTRKITLTKHAQQFVSKFPTVMFLFALKKYEMSYPNKKLITKQYI